MQVTRHHRPGSARAMTQLIAAAIIAASLCGCSFLNGHAADYCDWYETPSLCTTAPPPATP